MTSSHLLIAVITIALTAGGTACYRAWLATRVREKELDHELAIRLEESRRFKNMAEVMSRPPTGGTP
jgi:hypothetical protein